MKDLSKYIKESQEDGKGGHWEYRTDSNGKASRVWIDYAELIAKRKASEAAAKKAAKDKTDEIKKRAENKRKAKDEYEDLEQELWDLNDEIKELNHEYNEMMIDQEEDVGQWYAKRTEEGDKKAEEVANEYGKRFGEIEEEVKQKSKRIQEIEKRMSELEKIMYE